MHTTRNQAQTAARIPASHRDLLMGGGCVALSTVMPNGQPQSTPVWCNLDGGDVLVNTMRGFRKERNMRANPRVTLLAYDPLRPPRHIEVRGAVTAMTEAGAREHLDQLTQLCLRRPYEGRTIFRSRPPLAFSPPGRAHRGLTSEGGSRHDIRSHPNPAEEPNGVSQPERR